MRVTAIIIDPTDMIGCPCRDTFGDVNVVSVVMNRVNGAWNDAVDSNVFGLESV